MLVQENAECKRRWDSIGTHKLEIIWVFTDSLLDECSGRHVDN